MILRAFQRRRANPGVQLPAHKDYGELPRAENATVPERLTISLQQSIGPASLPVVRPGERVLKGQKIAEPPKNAPGSYLHAPTSGEVTTVEKGVAIDIRADGKDELHPDCLPIEQPLSLPPADMRKRIAEAGIVGLGGAMFPTALKLNPGPGVSTLIVNGVECEPYINCDNQLMQDDAHAVLRGTQLMLHMLGASEALLAIKQNHIAARNKLTAALDTLGDPRIRLVVVDDIYPAGGERQLIETISGRQVPANGLPADIGIVCQNVATAAAIDHYCNTGEPLIRRLVTIAGNTVQKPKNMWVRIGTPVNRLFESVPVRIIAGGPMMGQPLSSLSSPVTKAHNCLIADDPVAADSLQNVTNTLPCIRCGDCVNVCPAGLSPQLLHAAGRHGDIKQIEALGALECIECGACDYVCPSAIKLSAEFRNDKHAIWEQHLLAMRAKRSELRFAAHEVRRNQEDQTEAEQLDAQTATFHDAKDDSKAALDDLLKRIGADNK